MAHKTDFELIEACNGGDITGFNELVRRYQERVYWIARRIIGSHDEADDIVQDVFIRAYEGLRNFRSEANYYTWLYRITVNVSLNALRKKKIKNIVPYDFMLSEILPGDSKTDGSILRQEYTTILERAIERLPAKQKVVFMMRYYDELPFNEMAKTLKKSVGGTKANYFHALRKISDYVRKEMAD